MASGRGKASGISLTMKDASVVLAMTRRGDRDHDIAAWFGVNQGRIAEVKDGSHGLILGSTEPLPPKGPPGLKGRVLRAHVVKAITALDSGGAGATEALKILKDGLQKYNADEV